MMNYEWIIYRIEFLVLSIVSGGDMDDSSPYEPVPQPAPNRHHDAFRLASISSGIKGL